MKQSQISNFFKTPSSVPATSLVRDQQPTASVPDTNHVCGQESVQERISTKHKNKVYDATKRDRVWQENWLCSYNWLRYDKKSNVMYCEACREFVHLHPNRNVAMIKGKYVCYIFLLS